MLVSGARAAGLDAAYVKRLAALPTYTPTAATLALREMLPPLDRLQAMTMEELTTATDEAHGHVALLGYVLKLPREKIRFRRC